jgi:hypothetical protein
MDARAPNSSPPSRVSGHASRSYAAGWASAYLNQEHIQLYRTLQMRTVVPKFLGGGRVVCRSRHAIPAYVATGSNGSIAAEPLFAPAASA